MTTQQESTTNLILDLYRKYGNELYFGENVTQLQHALQTVELAKSRQSDDETILAAFLHDIGHICMEGDDPRLMMDAYGTVDHEILGAEFLRKAGFSSKICDLIASHVQAKRYLTFADPEYFKRLSDASKKTLEFQGGPMNKEEAEQFRNDILFDNFILLRKWDEEAKSEIPVSEDLSAIRDLMVRHLEIQNHHQNP